MKKYIAIVLVFSFSLSAIAQKTYRQKQKEEALAKKQITQKVEAKELEAFIVSGYEITTYSFGDFNEDTKQDAAVLLNKVDEKELAKNSDKPIERILLILSRDKNGKLVQFAKNEKAVYCYGCGSEFGSPLADVVIEGNTIVIQHEAGKADRWTRIITFKYNYDRAALYLQKDAISTYSISGGKPQSETKTRSDFGMITFEEFDIYSEDLKKKEETID